MRSEAKAKLAYFGLPGVEALDVRAWSKDLRYVAAVERRATAVAAIEKVFEMQLPDIQFRAHFGEADAIIVANRGKQRTVGGQPDRPYVSTIYKEEVDGNVWDFDIVNLDYYGSFLPLPIGGPAYDRANALRTLFDKSRQDSWRRWVLMLTTNAGYAGQEDEKLLRQYLESSKTDCSADAVAIIDGLLTFDGDLPTQAARLIYGVAALLLATCASSANLSAVPRGVVLYSGANGQPMIHLAYDFRPTAAPLAPPVARAELLRSPILNVRTPETAPWFELAATQAPGLTRETGARCLDFMEESTREAILSTGTW